MKDREQYMKKKKKQFWFDEETDQMLKDYSKRTGINQSQIVRMLIRGYQPKEKPDVQFYAYMRQLYGISNNLKQLATIANKYKTIDSSRLTTAIEEINGFMLEIERHFLVPEEENPFERKN